MITIDVYKDEGQNLPFSVNSFTTKDRKEAEEIFKRELRKLSSLVKHPKLSDSNGLVQVRTNRGRLIGEIEVNK